MSTEHAPSLSLFLSRIVWMMFGPLFLLLCAGKVISTGNGWFTPADIAYFVVLAVTLFARWFEFLKGQPQTATGDPATAADLHRYTLAMLALGLGVWVVANLIGNYLLAS
jgi:hypothetical protein